MGEAAFTTDDEGEVSLTPLWSDACDAFLHAAMAYGAPELLSPAETAILVAAWAKRYGSYAH